VKQENHFVGVPAVIDKDRLSSLIAIKLNADALIISTAVDSVKTGFGTAKEQSHSVLTIDQCEDYMAQGEFPKGSMGPKVGSLMEACLHNPNLTAILCQPGDALKSLRGEKGTTIVAK
jgi:carbamate kinase